MALQGYLLPQNRYIEPQAAVAAPGAIAGPELGLPALNDNYANVQGVTDEFIDTVGQIKSYAHDMAKTYGIDVTKPDYSQPGGGQPYRTFQELTAKSIMTGGDLKKRMTENTVINKGVLEGNVLATEGYEQAPLDASIQDRAVSTKLLPEVEQAARYLMSTYDTKAGAARATASFKAPLVQKLQALIQSDPENAQFYQRQIDALPDAIYEPPIFSPSTTNPPGKKNYEAEALKEISNQALGRWTQGQYTEDVDAEGNVILISKNKEGQKYGYEKREVGSGSKKREVQVDRVIDFWEKRPDGSVWVNFKPSKEDGGKFQPEPERVDDQNPGTVVANFFQSNAHLGNYGTALGQARDLGWTDASGYVNPNSLPYETQADTTDLSTKDQYVKGGVTTYLTQLRSDIDTWSASKTPTLTIKVGNKNLVLKKGITGRYLEEDGVEIKDGMNNKELIDLISSRYKKEISSDQLKNLKNSPSSQSAAEKKAEELINKYAPQQ